MNGDGYRPESAGCYRCGTQRTVGMDGQRGRWCANCAPADAAPLVTLWQRQEAMETIDRDSRFAWLRPHLARLVGAS